MARGRRLKRALVAAIAVITAVSLAGCGGSAGATSDAAKTPATASLTPTPEPPPTISLEPADSTDDVRPDSAIAVTAQHGRLTSVTLQRKADDGRATDPLPGSFSADRSSWVAKAGLRPDATYVLTAAASGAAGTEPVTKTSTFTTAESRKRFRAEIRPTDGDTVGIAMPVVLTFNRKVSDDRRADVERALTVETSVPVVGSWGWVSDREIHWRPKEYWPPNTKVTLHAALTGVPAADGIWGDRDSELSFRVTDRPVRSVVDLAKHRQYVYLNDKLVKTIPVTAGKSGFITRSGTKVIMEKRAHMRMRSASIGISNSDNPEYYDLDDVRYAMRITWSGEFLHAAPWSVGSHGRANVSHGCTGMSTTNAKWLFNISRVGDPVQFINSNRGLERGNGYTDWNVDWDTWLGRSAIGPVGSTSHQQLP